MPSINAVPLEGNSQESSRSPTQNPIDRSRVLPSKRGFKLASLNIDKLTTHLDELKIFLVSNDIDVLAINETKLNEYITDNEVSISGYDIVSRDRTTNGGGGVCFYVKKSINFSVRNDLCMGSLANLCIEIRKPRSKSFIVATWYRPPNSLVSIFSPFEELIGKLDSLNTEFYLLGDLNCNMAASQFDSDTRKLLTITDVYGLQQLITEPTRITETSATLIDLIFTNCPDKVLCSGVRHIGISDHSMVYVYRKLAINGQSKGHTNITYRNFRSFNRDKFRSDVASQDWDHINNSSNPNDMWNEWKESFLAIVNKHAPLRTTRVRARGSPWITSEQLELRAIRSKNPNDWVHFKRQRNKVNSATRLAKQVYYQNMLNEHKGDSRKTWQIINELSSRNFVETSVKQLNVNEQSVTAPAEIAHEFNRYFATIGPKLASDIPSSDGNSYLNYLTSTDKEFQFRPTSTNEVFSLLNKLKKSKAVGLDKISSRLIRECADLICKPLCYIFNQSLNVGVFPDDWKCARVTPLFKQGERDDLNNYRPISVIPVIAKVFERIVYNQLYAYLTKHNVICKCQSGFRSIHSTVTALLGATNTWAYNIDRGNLTYAGDNTGDIESRLNHDLENVKKWLIANKLTLNMTKTEFMLIGSRQRLYALTNPTIPEINGAPITQVSVAKSLGVLIDNNLNWSSHVDKLTKKVASGIGALKRIRHLVPQTTLRSIYHALLQPHFDYCNVVWGNCGITLHDKLQKLQNRAARVLTFSNFDANASELFKILGWKNLVSQQQIALATMVYKCLQGLAPEYLCSKFTNRESVYSLRDSERKLNVPFPRTNYYRNSFSYRGATVWNSLPLKARQAESLGLFKNLIKDIF